MRVTPRTRTPTLLAMVVVAGGCVYYNGLYNAELAFRDGEDARLSGDFEAARTAYVRAADGAERAWQAEPEGRWAAPALLLAARSAVRSGDPARARRELRALEALPAPPPKDAVRGRILDGAVLVLEQRPREALQLLEDVRPGSEDAEWRAEAWLWRARALGSLGRFDEAWAAWDAAAVHRPELRWSIEAERVSHALAFDRPGEASVSLEHLLTARQGEAWADTVLVVADRAGRMWGPDVAAQLLDPVRRDRWGPAARDRVLRRQVDLLLSAADTSGADDTLAWVAEGTTDAAVSARIDLARLRIARAEAFADLVPVRRLLLPVAADPRARDLLSAMMRTDVLADWGVEGDPLAWFSAGEVARDDLGAPGLAGALFVTAAESDSDGRWTGKALLAALTVLGEADLRERIRRRALARELDPWVDRLTPGYLGSDEFLTREAELDRRVRDLRLRAAEEAGRRAATLDPAGP